jgi:hypothetical protein
MSKIFRRPMFRKGGNVGEGIMTGLVDREMYSEGTASERIKKALEPYNQPAIDPMAELLISAGLRGFSETGGGSTFGNLAKAFEDPTKQYFKSSRDRQDSAREVALAGVESDISTELEQEKMRLTAENAKLKRDALSLEGNLDRESKYDIQIKKNEGELAELQFKLDNPDAAGMQVTPAFENVVSDLTTTYTQSKNPAVKIAPDQTAFNVTKFRREADPKIIAKYKGFKPYTYDSKGTILALPIDNYQPGDIVYDPVNSEFLVFDNAGGTYRLNPLTYEIEE